MKRVRIDPKLHAASSSWEGLLDFADVMPDGWSLAGGQMIYVHTQFHGAVLARPSLDVDVVIDIRAHPDAAEEVFATLKRIGFQGTAPDPKNRVHRWLRGDAQIDVLQPRYLGEHAHKRLRRAGVETIGAPGAQHLLNRTESFEVIFGARIQRLRVPNLMGAIASKAAAYSEILLDRAKRRHLVDVLTLVPLLSARELRANPSWRRLERTRLKVVAAAVNDSKTLDHLEAYFSDARRRFELTARIADFYRDVP